MRLVTAQRFIPLRVSVGSIPVGAGLTMEEALRRVEQAVREVGAELGSRGRLVNVGFSVSQVSLGTVEGILVVGWGLVED